MSCASRPAKPVSLDDLLLEGKNARFVGIDGHPDPVRLGKTERLHPGKVLDLAATISGALFTSPEQGFVHAEVVRVAMEKRHRLAERHHFSFEGREEGGESGWGVDAGCADGGGEVSFDDFVDAGWEED